MNIDNKIIFGRKSDLSLLLSDLSKDMKTIRLVIGESGVGKSSLLDNFYFSIKERTNLMNQNNNGNISLFIGYYSKRDSLVSELKSEEYPLHVVLSNLIENIKELRLPVEEQKIVLKRLEQALKEFAEKEGKQIAKDISKEMLKKIGLENAVPYLGRFIEIFKGKKSSIMNAEELLKQREQLLDIYTDMFSSISNEFSERRIILIFDQIESIGKASLDFLFNFIKFLPDNFHIYLAFKTEENWQNTADKTLFDYTYKNIRSLNGEIKRVEELQIKDIDTWIQTMRNRTLPDIDLARIKEYSGGIPLILEPWINNSKDLNYEEINRDDHCQQILNLRNGLTDDDQIRLSKLSVMMYPIQDEYIAKDYLSMNSVDHFNPFNRRMEDRGIFEQNSQKVSWFRHDLIKYCFENELPIHIKQKYHNILVDYYKRLRDNNKENNVHNILFDENENIYKLNIAYCYHLHNSGLYAESFIQNRKLANYAITLGDLDLAEKCFQRALYATSQDNSISRSERIDSLENFTTEVLHIWGRYDEALNNYLELKDYYYDTNNQQGIVRILLKIGTIYERKGEYEEAIKKYEESLEIARKLGSQTLIDNTLFNIGNIHGRKGEYEEAIKRYEESLEIKRKLGSQEDIPKILNNIGYIQERKGEYEEAIKRYEEGLEIARNLRDQDNISFILNNIGNIHGRKGENEEAIKKYEESLEIARKLGSQDNIARALNNIGTIYERKGEYEEAIKKYEESLEIARKLGSQEGISIILKNLGDIHGRKGENEEAIKKYEESLEIARKLGNRQFIDEIINIIRIIKEN